MRIEGGDNRRSMDYWVYEDDPTNESEERSTLPRTCQAKYHLQLPLLGKVLQVSVKGLHER